jgi:MFS family permease
MPPIRAAASVLLPFAAGYYLSYLFRTINALSADALGADLHLGAAELGALTAAYFFTFAVLQLPIGVALDRYGPRRVQLVLLPLAAIGATLFSTGEGFVALLLGRALIGAGVAAALMAGLKALVLWFPKKRLALANGCYIMLGALGAVTATAPAEVLMHWLGWRGLFAALAAATAAVTVVLWLFAPRDPVPETPGGITRPRLRDVYRDVQFWRLAPLSACCIGTAFALQGLWAGPWLTDVAGLDRAAVVDSLFLTALGLCAGALSLGVVTDRLQRRGWRPKDVLAIVATASMLAQLALALRLPVPPQVLWTLLGGVGSATVLSYAAIGEVFPKALAGRANGALNLLHIGTAFLVQAGIGIVVDRWPADSEGHHPALAYTAAFGLNLAAQVLALAWFLIAPQLQLGHARPAPGSLIEEGGD